MKQPDPADFEALIADRSGFLRVLTAAPRSKRDLTELFDCSRSTIDRVLRSLADAYLVEYQDGEWHATAAGVCAYRKHDEYASFLTDLADAAPILAALPTETPIGEAFLPGSTAHIAESSVPDAVLDVMLCSVRGASVVRGLVPKAPAGSATEFYEAAVTDDSATLELVLDGDVFDRLYELNPQETKDALDKPSVTLFRGTIPWTFGLWIADETEVGVVVYTEQGIQGCMLNDTKTAVEWATEQYDSVERDAEEIFLRGGPKGIR
ncbi:winged helix-turn-helix domain-containing protein [Halorubrum trapanicum]|uniref:helix-turn-helix transcriptional regulator n=1 Tax=Halorubrum trapanicum TaxID=29284 RepID=UPI000BBACEA9|nr:transcriptional regulator [Halorubrum trapanicum]